MTEREDDDQELSDLAAIAPDAKLASEVMDIARRREDNDPPGVDEAPGAGRDGEQDQPRG